MLQAVDDRLYKPNVNMGGNVFQDENTTIRLNEELMKEIEHAQKQRQVERGLKVHDGYAYKVEENDPSA